MKDLPRKYWLLAIIAPIVLILDQVTKQIVIARFRLGESIPVIDGLFNLTYVRNTGAAFGILADSHPEFRIPFFMAVPFLALGVIFYIFRKLPEHDFKLPTALALVTGGAIGNLIDRLIYGYVIDFLDFHWKLQAHFPAFNVADSAICVGVGVMMLDLLLQKEGAHASSAR